jgi:hypothetical protein
VQRHVGVLAIEGRQLRDELQTVPRVELGLRTWKAVNTTCCPGLFF